MPLIEAEPYSVVDAVYDIREGVLNGGDEILDAHPKAYALYAELNRCDLLRSEMALALVLSLQASAELEVGLEKVLDQLEEQHDVELQKAYFEGGVDAAAALGNQLAQLGVKTRTSVQQDGSVVRTATIEYGEEEPLAGCGDPDCPCAHAEFPENFE